MVQIDFAERRILVHLALVGADASSVVRALAAQVPGDHDALTHTELGEAVTLRPRGFVFDTGPQPPEQVLDHDPNTVGGMQTEYLLTASASVPLPHGIDGLLFVCDATPGRREAHRASLEALCTALREVWLQPETIPMVFLWTLGTPDEEHQADLEGTVRGADGLSVPSYAGEPGEAGLQAFARLGGAVLERLNKQYCSCMFDPDRPRLYDAVRLDIASGVWGSVLARESRPRANTLGRNPT